MASTSAAYAADGFGKDYKMYGNTKDKIVQSAEQPGERGIKMKKSRFGRMVILVLAVITVFAFSTTALAYSQYTTISASSSTSQVKKRNITRACYGWSASSDSYFTGTNNTVRLTVRPYEADTSTRLSLAKTFSSSVEKGGQTYDILVSNVDVKASSTENGVLCGLTGTWYF